MRREAELRMQDALAFLESAKLGEAEQSGAWRDVVVSNAVHAGIAAGDVICCMNLSRRSASPGHEEAIELLETVAPVGKEAAKALGDLIGLKGKAEYLPAFASPNDVKVALRRATRLVELAEAALHE